MTKSKTETLQRKNVSIELLHVNPLNPNEMDARQFNLLVDNLEKVGFTDPILVRPHPEIEGEYRIIGGAHRLDAAKHLGYTDVPVTIITDPEFTEDSEKFQIVRHNIIGGKMDPAKFAKLVDSLGEKYSNEIAAEMFGFSEQAEFEKLIKTTTKSLPKEMQAEFKSAAKEIKTIDELASLLNHMFANYGDTLDRGYMIFDFGGHESIWLRLQTKQLKDFRTMAGKIKDGQRSLDHVFANLLSHLASEDGGELLGQMIGDAPAVVVKQEATYQTLDFLSEV